MVKLIKRAWHYYVECCAQNPAFFMFTGSTYVPSTRDVNK